MPVFLGRFAALLLSAAMLAGCSGGGGGSGSGRGRAGSGPSGSDQGIAFAVTEVRVEHMAKSPRPFPDDVRAAVSNALNAYLDRGLVKPLRTGKPPVGLEPLFTPAALARATTADRAALLEDGSALSGAVTAERANALLTLLTAPDGSNVVVSAAVDVALTVRSKSDAVSVVRTGEVVLLRDEQGWRIDSYDLRTARDSVPGR